MLQALDLSGNLTWFDNEDDKTCIELLKALIVQQAELSSLDLTGNGVSSYIHFWKVVPDSKRISFSHGHRRATLGPFKSSSLRKTKSCELSDESNSEDNSEDKALDSSPSKEPQSAAGPVLETRPMTTLEADGMEGMTYEGQWLEGTDIRQGWGTLIWPDGAIYEGEWKDNRENGQGRLIHAYGDVYEGDWVDGRPHGSGTLTTGDGATYSGEFKAGAKHGRGNETNSEGTCCYEGEFNAGAREGQGKLVYQDRTYIGDFKAG